MNPSKPNTTLEMGKVITKPMKFRVDFRRIGQGRGCTVIEVLVTDEGPVIVLSESQDNTGMPVKHLIDDVVTYFWRSHCMQEDPNALLVFLRESAVGGEQIKHVTLRFHKGRFRAESMHVVPALIFDILFGAAVESKPLIY